MIKNFDEIKKQLSELSSVINSFKSEAVQLKIVELIFDFTEEKPEEETEDRTKKTKKKKIKKKAKAKEPGNEVKKKTKSPAGEGAFAMLSKLYEGDFFKKAKTISHIVEHCDVNFAKKFKANEFSGRLARMVREGQLKRIKNTEGQYEYTK